MSQTFSIDGREIGRRRPTYIVAELSANHAQDYEEAAKLVRAAKQAGADAVKIQTYTADTITLNCDNDCFQIKKGTLWEGQTLYSLYQKAYTPWEWQPRLQALAKDIGIHFFSTPFDATAVDFLEKMHVPAYKIASFELVDLPLIRRVAQTGKPMILSTGMATLAEIDEALAEARAAGATQIALLKANSAYPAPVQDMNLATIPHMAQAFSVPVGLSDHTLGIHVPVAAVALGACIVEKHLVMSRQKATPDSAFSLQPEEFENMVAAIRAVEQAVGAVSYHCTPQEVASRAFRKSLFVVEDVKAGDPFTAQNVRCIRPSHGLHARYLPVVLGRMARCAIAKGTPLKWELIT